MVITRLLRRLDTSSDSAERRRERMSVEFTVACPDCGHELVAVANPGNPYDWDWDDCICRTRRKRKP